MCVARKAQGDRTVPTDLVNLAPAVCPRKASATVRVIRSGLPATGDVQVNQIALSIIWVSCPLLAPPIWVASTLPFLNTIRVGMLRTP